MERCRVMYDCLYHGDGNFDAGYGYITVEDKLENQFVHWRLWRVSYVSH